MPPSRPVALFLFLFFPSYPSAVNVTKLANLSTCVKGVTGAAGARLRQVINTEYRSRSTGSTGSTRSTSFFPFIGHVDNGHKSMRLWAQHVALFLMTPYTNKSIRNNRRRPSLLSLPTLVPSRSTFQCHSNSRSYSALTSQSLSDRPSFLSALAALSAHTERLERLERDRSIKTLALPTERARRGVQ